jgi:hypothetical protein
MGMFSFKRHARVFLTSVSLALGLSFAFANSAQAQQIDEAQLWASVAQREDFGVPLQSLKGQGYLPARPRTRQDFNDFYVPRQPFSVMGSRVIMVRENDMIRDIGCCADPGICVLFPVSNETSVATIQNFARTNKCELRNNTNEISGEVPRGLVSLDNRSNYRLLSCADLDESRGRYFR